MLLSALVAVTAYLQALHFPFISDDVTYIPENSKLLALQFSDLWRLFAEPYNCCREYLPLRDFSYWLDVAIFGQNPAASRSVNIALCLLSLPLVYGTTLKLWRYFHPTKQDSAAWVAMTITALFALHPALVESVVWISGRKYILSNLFAMLALWFAVNARGEKGLSVRYAIATLIAFVAMMLSKTSYVGVAGVIIILWSLFWLDIPAQNRPRSLLIWPFTILLAAILLTLVFISKNNGFDGMPFYFGVEALTRTFAALGWFARLAVSPESRHYFYPVLEVSYLPLMIAGGVAVLAATIYGLKVLISQRSLEGFALVTFLLLCLPYMQLVPNHPPSLASDRYIALAIWPSTILIVALCWRLKPIPRVAILASLAILWTIQTFERPNDWRSPEAMVEADASANPDHYLPALLKISGIQLPTRKYREALNTASNITNPEFRDALTSLIKSDYEVKFGTIPKGSPDDAIALLLKTGELLKKLPEQIKWNAPARYTWDAFRDDMLIGEWNALVAQYPNDMLVQYYTGLWNVEIHRNIFAVSYLRAATESQQLPVSIRGSAYKTLGMALLNSGYPARAEAPLNAALEQFPPDQEAYCLLSSVYKQTGLKKAKQSEEECRKYERMGNASK